jgi:uncharacterized membrane protein YfcA
MIAIVLFVYNGAIAWYQGIIVMLGTLLGGFVAAHLSRQLPQDYVRVFVILTGFGMSLYFFYQTIISQ